MPRAASFRAPTAQMLAAHPFGGPAHSLSTGLVIGKYTYRHEPWFLDLYMEKANGILPALNGIALGKKNCGKTSLMKIIAHRYVLIGAGLGYMRVAVNDHRPEAGRSEYAALADALGGEVYDIASRNVNPFEASLELGDLSVLEMANMLCEHVNKAPIIGAEFDALKVAVWMMLQLHPLLWSIETLLNRCLAMTIVDIQREQADMDSRMRERLEARIKKFAKNDFEGEGIRLELAGIYRDPSTQAVDEIMRARFKIASHLRSLLEGKYGKMLGGGDSLFNMLTQPIVVKDWRGVTGDAVGLMRAIDHRIQINAIERELFHLYPNIELDDEDHRSMEHLTYAKSKSLKSKINRSTRMINISGSHRLSDYRRGGAGSELAAYGQSIIDDMDFFFVGKQTPVKEHLDELQQRLNLNEQQRTDLPLIPEHVFGAKIGETEPYEYVQALPNKKEWEIIKSNKSNDDMVNRPGLDPRQYAAVAAATGFQLKEEV
jgi:hypothetical protein